MTTMKLGKQLAYILRHAPESVGVTLDSAGWVEVTELATAVGVTVEEIAEAVAADDKQRYALVGGRIRASQGHSIPVQIEFQAPEIILEVLFHGTTEKALETILGASEGLKPMSRQFVHLSGNKETAVQVASRRKAQNMVLLTVNTAEAQQAGVQFFLSENGIWLTTAVPASCLRVI